MCLGQSNSCGARMQKLLHQRLLNECGGMTENLEVAAAEIVVVRDRAGSKACITQPWGSVHL